MVRNSQAERGALLNKRQTLGLEKCRSLGEDATQTQQKQDVSIWKAGESEQ